MSDLTNTPIGFYPEDKARTQRILAAMPEIKNVSALVRFAIKELDERVAKRQKEKEPALELKPGDRMVIESGPMAGPHVVTPIGRRAPQPPSDGKVASTERHSDDQSKDVARLLEAIGDRSHRSVDQLAGVARGTTTNVQLQRAKLATAGGGRLLKWVESVEAKRSTR